MSSSLRYVWQFGVGTAQPASPEAAHPGKRPAPFSLRLGEAERAVLLEKAKGVPLGALIKAKLFDRKTPRARRNGAIIQDRNAFDHALALLGKSEMTKNIASLAQAAKRGTLALDPYTEAKLLISCQQIEHIHTMMMIALRILFGALR